jgi:hypothetical protein
VAKSQPTSGFRVHRFCEFTEQTLFNCVVCWHASWSKIVSPILQLSDGFESPFRLTINFSTLLQVMNEQLVQERGLTSIRRKTWIQSWGYLHISSTRRANVSDYTGASRRGGDLAHTLRTGNVPAKIHITYISTCPHSTLFVPPISTAEPRAYTDLHFLFTRTYRIYSNEAAPNAGK